MTRRLGNAVLIGIDTLGRIVEFTLLGIAIFVLIGTCKDWAKHVPYLGERIIK
jgi:hypothetical protein